MDLSAFFDPIRLEIFPERGYWSEVVPRYEQVFPNWQAADVVLIGCPDANAKQADSHMADQVRERLYGLAVSHEGMKLVDLGNLRVRESASGFYEMLAYVLAPLIQAGKLICLLGGRQDHLIGQVLAYETVSLRPAIVQIDAALDMRPAAPAPYGYMHTLRSEYPEYLGAISNLGYHRFRASISEIERVKGQHDDLVRYGSLSGQIIEAEPYVRKADMVSIDLSSVRAADAPATYYPAPAGFSSLEMCQLARFVGLGYKVSVVSLTEMNPLVEDGGRTAMLAALALWYLVDGYYSRWEDYPQADRKNLRQYTVQLHASIPHIHFFKHLHSQRWWMEVPVPDERDTHVLIPCSKMDYECAKRDEIPQRWWNEYHRLSM